MYEYFINDNSNIIDSGIICTSYDVIDNVIKCIKYGKAHVTKY